MRTLRFVAVTLTLATTALGAQQKRPLTDADVMRMKSVGGAAKRERKPSWSAVECECRNE